jgi:hypothetical protein
MVNEYIIQRVIMVRQRQYVRCMNLMGNEYIIQRINERLVIDIVTHLGVIGKIWFIRAIATTSSSCSFCTRRWMDWMPPPRRMPIARIHIAAGTTLSLLLSSIPWLQDSRTVMTILANVSAVLERLDPMDR